MLRCLLQCLCLDLHAFMLYAMLMLRSSCFYDLCHVYAKIYMLLCSMPCLCLDLCLFGPYVMPMLRSMCLCAPCHIWLLKYLMKLLESKLCICIHFTYELLVWVCPCAMMLVITPSCDNVFVMMGQARAFHFA